jgi:PAS domain S-box-containing protein
MRQAADFLIDKPGSIDRGATAPETLAALVNSDIGLIAIWEQESPVKIITFKSALEAFSAADMPAKLKVEDLAVKVCPTIRYDAQLSNFLPELQKQGLLVVVGEGGSYEGVVTLAGVVGYLAEKYEEIGRELDAVINFSSDEVLVADGSGKVLRANALFEENFGVKLSDVLGKTVDELEKKKIFFPSVTKLVLDQKKVQTVIQSHRDGRKLLATGTPAFNPDGSVFRVIVNTRDITRLNRLKQQLEEAELFKNRYQQELLELRQGYLKSGEIVAASPVMLELLKVARRIAVADSTVLLTGESGSGKGMIARYIHNSSPRHNKPFTVVNCGAIPENLLESELFGYAGGAFTGAKREGKIGKLELANEGTLFLDEITELPLNLQVKLLHVLQEEVICRIGGTREVKLNLRFIAATNRDISRLVEEGRFREDLYFRLDVIPLLVPPLRERREDIKILAEQFLKKLNRRYLQNKTIAPEVEDYLQKYSWPGNVRELENLIERMMIVVEGDEICVQHLPGHLVPVEPGVEAVMTNAGRVKPLKEARAVMEKELLTAALHCCRTTYEMANLLEVDQSTVVRLLKKYNLSPSGNKYLDYKR